MKLLAIALVWHDFNMAYFDGEILRYHKLERTKQIKRYTIENFWEWIYEIKNIWGVDLDEIDEIAINFDPTVYGEIPKEIFDTVNGNTGYNLLYEEINFFKNYCSKPIYYIGHHYAHSLSAWMLTDNDPDIAIVVDGVGDGRSWSVYRKEQLIAGGRIECGSIGFGMRDVGKFLGVKYQSNSEDDIAGKVMGLQSYGTVDNDFLNILRQFGVDQMKEIFLEKHWYAYTGDDLIAKLTPMNWVATVHQRANELLFELFEKYAKEDEIISYSGGVAQNVLWNTTLKKKYPNLIIPPHSADEGLALGLIECLRRKNDLPKFKLDNFPYIQCDYSPTTAPSLETIKQAATLLSEGKTVGWYQGQGEVGPRALGNRSILMDPRIVNGRKKVNQIKRRENYRPFGASVLEEHASDYFDLDWRDEFMLYTTQVKTSGFDAITHVDGTCRVQTVGDRNPTFRLLLEEFFKLTGCPILLNTSLNIAGKPLAGFPENARDILSSTELEYIFIGDNCFKK
jgi:carbamoyltransferase